MSKHNKVTGCKVILGETMPINVALRKFKQKVDDSGILESVKKNMYYEKPTAARKRKKGAAVARWQKKLRDDSLPKKLY